MRRTIGQSARAVTAIGLGEWPLSNVHRPTADGAVEVIRAALDAGVDFIDTADAYCLNDDEFGHGERLVGDALRRLGATAEVTVATKVGNRRPGGDWVRDARPEWIRKACDDSLARLGHDTIALYQLHAPDPDVPFEDTIGALADLRAAGKVEHIGLSNVDRDLLDRARAIVPVASVQNECNAWKRDDVDNGLIEYCAREGIAYLPWFPLGGERRHRDLAGQAVVGELAAKYGVSPHRLLLRWLLALGDTVIPIPGATRPTSIVDSFAATTLEADDSDLARIGTIGA